MQSLNALSTTLTMKTETDSIKHWQLAFGFHRVGHRVVNIAEEMQSCIGLLEVLPLEAISSNKDTINSHNKAEFGKCIPNHVPIRIYVGTNVMCCKGEVKTMQHTQFLPSHKVSNLTQNTYLDICVLPIMNLNTRISITLLGGPYQGLPHTNVPCN